MNIILFTLKSLALTLLLVTFLAGYTFYKTLVAVYSLFLIVLYFIQSSLIFFLGFMYKKTCKYPRLYKRVNKIIWNFLLLYSKGVNLCQTFKYTLNKTTSKTHFILKIHYNRNKVWLFNYRLFKLKVGKFLKILFKFLLIVAWNLFKIFITIVFFLYGYQLHLFLYFVGAVWDSSVFTLYHFYKISILLYSIIKNILIFFYINSYPIFFVLRKLVLSYTTVRYSFYDLLRYKTKRALFFITYRRPKMWRLFKARFKNFMKDAFLVSMIFLFILTAILVIALFIWYTSENYLIAVSPIKSKLNSIFEYKKVLEFVYIYLKRWGIINEPSYYCGPDSEYARYNKLQLDSIAYRFKVIKLTKMFLIPLFFSTFSICVNDIKCRRYGWTFYFRKGRLFE